MIVIQSRLLNTSINPSLKRCFDPHLGIDFMLLLWTLSGITYFDCQTSSTKYELISVLFEQFLKILFSLYCRYKEKDWKAFAKGYFVQSKETQSSNG